MTTTARVQRIVSCRETRLEEVAKELDIGLAEATNLRSYWTNHISGKVSPTGVSLLNEVSPSTVMLRRPCCKCQKVITVRAGFILKMVSRHGMFKTPTVCEVCKKKPKQSPPKKKKKAAKKTLPKPTPAPVAAARKPAHADDVSINQPFRALANLDIPVKGKRARKN